LRLRQLMANESVFLTGDEASSLQEALQSIVSTGLQVQDSEFQLPSTSPREKSQRPPRKALMTGEAV